MEQIESHKAVKDGLESKLREYALNEYVRVEICLPSEAEGNPPPSVSNMGGPVSF